MNIWFISYENHDDSRSYVMATHKGPPSVYRSFQEAEMCAQHMRLPGYRVEELNIES